MLKMLDCNDIETIKHLTADSLLGARIYCYAQCYGFDKSFIDFWAGDSVIISRFDDVFTIKACDDADFDEIRDFIDIIGAGNIVTDYNTARRLGYEVTQIKSGFVYCGNKFVSDEVSRIDDDKICELYNIISDAIPDSFSKDRNSYLNFLSDYMYRKNRGYSRAYGIIVNNNIISTAITSSESDSAAIISGVASLNEYRGSGLGKKTVLTLATILNNENKDVYVIALNDSAKGFYEHIGFSESCKIAYISKKV